MKKFLLITILALGCTVAGYFFSRRTDSLHGVNVTPLTAVPSPTPTVHPLSIESLRRTTFAGGSFQLEETLAAGSNYNRYRASYTSEGYKIYGLLTVPNGAKPSSGWPIIIFNHGYIPPAEYRTTERYIAYTDAFSRNGYILFRPDYRGHGSSEGTAAGGYGSNAYTIDVLNALAVMKKYPDGDPARIGMWGHSMGGHITLRSMVVDRDIKAGVIWAGVVGSYPDLLNNWRRRNSNQPTISPAAGRWRNSLIAEFGEPDERSPVWQSLSSTAYLSEISGPLQLHHGTADSSVPVSMSERLNERMKKANKPVELYIYPGDDHNIATNFQSAITRSIAFFDKNVKQASVED